MADNLADDYRDEEDEDLDNLNLDQSLSSSNFKSLSNEILEDLVDYAQTQGTVSNSEIRSAIDDYIYEKMDRGELDPEMDTDELSKMVFEEWQRKKEDLMFEDEDDF